MPKCPKPGAEYFLNISFLLGVDTLWARCGHEITFAQFPLPVKVPKALPAVVSSLNKLDLEEDAENIYLSASNGVLVEINKNEGVITSMERDGLQLIERGPRFNLYRAPTDNDRGFGSRFENEWHSFGYHHMQSRIESVSKSMKNGNAVVKVVSRVSTPGFLHGIDVNYLYQFEKDGSFRLELTGVPSEGMPHFPRLGVQMMIPDCLDTAEWFGLGPGEAYSDTKAAQRVGLFKAGVDQLYTRYLRPQENGNRHQVRRVAFYDLHMAGLLVAGEPCIDFSAHRFTPEDFAAAKHPHELKERENIIVNLDWKQCGIGSGSCGPGTAEKYRIPAEKFKFAMRFRAIAPGELNDDSFFRF